MHVESSEAALTSVFAVQEWEVQMQGADFGHREGRTSGEQRGTVHPRV